VALSSNSVTRRKKKEKKKNFGKDSSENTGKPWSLFIQNSLDFFFFFLAFLSFSFCNIGDGNQGITHARQALYRLTTAQLSSLAPSKGD
jgi:hypothetical protein